MKESQIKIAPKYIKFRSQFQAIHHYNISGKENNILNYSLTLINNNRIIHISFSEMGESIC